MATIEKSFSSLRIESIGPPVCFVNIELLAMETLGIVATLEFSHVSLNRLTSLLMKKLPPTPSSWGELLLDCRLQFFSHVILDEPYLSCRSSTMPMHVMKD